MFTGEGFTFSDAFGDLGDIPVPGVVLLEHVAVDEVLHVSESQQGRWWWCVLNLFYFFWAEVFRENFFAYLGFRFCVVTISYQVLDSGYTEVCVVQ